MTTSIYEGVQHRVIKAHAAAEEKNGLYRGKPHIYCIEYRRGISRAGDELADDRPRDLRAHYVHRVLAAHRQHRHDEHQHAHTAYPVREHAPEHAAAAHRLDVREQRRAGGREAGDGLKQRVHIARDIAADDKGQRADKRHQYPRQADRREALARVDIAVFRLEQHEDTAKRCGRRDRDRKIEHIFAVAQSGDKRKHQQRRKDQQHHAEYPHNHSVIHSVYLSTIPSMVLSLPALDTIIA